MFFGFRTPFGRTDCFGQIASPVHSQGRKPEQRVGGDDHGRNPTAGLCGANLSITGTQKLFFLPEVHLDSPAPEVILNKLREIELRIAA